MIMFETFDLFFIVFFSLLFFALGFLLGTIRYRSRNIQMGVNIQRANENINKGNIENKKLQDEVRRLELNNHNLDIEINIIRQKVLSFNELEKRCTDEVDAYRNMLRDIEGRFRALHEKHHDIEKKLEISLSEKEMLSMSFKEKQKEVNTLQSKHDMLFEDYYNIKNKFITMETTLSRKEENFKEQMNQLSDTKNSLKEEFENLSNRIFEEKRETFAHTSRLNIETLLKPFREQIDRFQNRINEVHDLSLQGNASLKAEIDNVMKVSVQMNKEAANLTNALKGNSQQRGAWGEAQLRRTLELSGLLQGAHYDAQSSFRDDKGRKKQVDYLVKLPEGKHIIIDSKVSLLSYDRAVNAKDDFEYKAYIKRHVEAVRRHVDELSSKDYINLIGVKSPNFVLMFMPIEAAYISTFKEDKNLFEYAYHKGVILVSHTTLVPILRTVSNLWMIERGSVEAREISEKAGDIYNSVCTIAERLNKLGGTLGTISNHYNSTVKALSGQQGLYGKVSRFKHLSTKVSKTLPTLETIHTDFETERLGFIVELIDDEK